MKLTLTFETDTDKDTYFDDYEEFKDMLNLLNYKIAIANIRDRLREIVKYKLDEENADARKILENFYYEEFFELVNNINID